MTIPNQDDNLANEVYKLPIDLIEMDRLALQHRMWCVMIGGLFPTHAADSIHTILAPSDNRRPVIMDVGCGSGIWSTEMAKAFPHADVIGLDLNEQKYPEAPDNFRFVQGDISLGLPQFDALADVVHCRCVAQHVKDPQKLVNILASCLRPGGLLLLADGDWIVYDRDMKLVKPFVWDTTKDVQKQVENAGERSFYAGWLALFGDLTKSENYRPIEELIDASEAFTAVDMHSYLSPISWPGENIPNGRELGNIMNINQRNFFSGAKMTASKAGLTMEILDIWEKLYNKELDSCQLYNVWYYATAQKV
ncbi:S-adenosyl-L-methionine-dependent methyltransferase [Dendrothele bispora CBS 962.96]|uniref:S-adenosyl-L-methionine-dependent methyltransferase n=1 Tax=Dendrothele bispora (strain CBS 962.96) TaxID=1314807 RepID=A0A4S8MIQ9_DENBC|nr:S-adenosyl-L-methionine-dependent methyltransferase [Dendrothele bispora CBS 962.96]